MDGLAPDGDEISLTFLAIAITDVRV